MSKPPFSTRNEDPFAYLREAANKQRREDSAKDKSETIKQYRIIIKKFEGSPAQKLKCIKLLRGHCTNENLRLAIEQRISFSVFEKSGPPSYLAVANKIVELAREEGSNFTIPVFLNYGQVINELVGEFERGGMKIEYEEYN
ncbi:MAG: hypothetical protein EXS55_00820 [Candidatus Magasanikbacteria bacterium]|nr:hypothetical protein [Candidatus Magasanikbacteria bacterium]